MEHTIRKATAKPDHAVALVWEDEAVSVVSFANPAARGGVCEPMRDPARFVGRMSISHPEDAHRGRAAE